MPQATFPRRFHCRPRGTLPPHPPVATVRSVGPKHVTTAMPTTAMAVRAAARLRAAGVVPANPARAAPSVATETWPGPKGVMTAARPPATVAPRRAPWNPGTRVPESRASARVYVATECSSTTNNAILAQAMEPMAPPVPWPARHVTAAMEPQRRIFRKPVTTATPSIPTAAPMCARFLSPHPRHLLRRPRILQATLRPVAG